MLNNEYYKRIRILGYLIVGYSLIKFLGIRTATVFERLHTEYNYAKKNQLINRGCFGINEKEIANCLDISVEEVKNSLEQLLNLHFIEYYEINGTSIIYINQDKISQVIRDSENKNHYADWDNGLKSIQYNAYSMLENYFTK